MANSSEYSFYDIETLLTQLDSSKIKEEVDKQLAGIDFDTLRDDDELILAKMAFQGETNAVKYLLEKGANPNLESSTYHYYKGPAILYALQNNRSKTNTKVAVLKMLIDHGSDINVQVQWFDEEKNDTVTGNYVEYGLSLAMDNLRNLKDSEYAETRKSARTQIEGLQAMLGLIKEASINLKKETAQKLHEFLKVQTKIPQRIDAKEFYKKAMDELVVENRIHDLPEAAKKVCYDYLENESFMLTKEWASLIRHLVDISLTFEEVSEVVYDEAVSFLDDEGWLCQGWESYNWFSELVEVLSNEHASKNPEWADLMILIINESEEFDASVEWEIQELLEEPWVKAHPSFQKIAAAVQDH